MIRDLINQEQSILTSFDKQSEKAKNEYRLRLTASIDVARFLLKQGLPFRGSNEGGTSIKKKENILDLSQWNASWNNMMTAPNIPKEIVNACAKETMKPIVEEMNGDYFGILVY
ncbi:uncharacterized protein [Nicotiana sylvestris]|uniref:uncharacterized protein n=1 Tax=Nicotiana sylvestris TaxID=4096 RepID=UPI00388CDBEA